MSSSGPWEVVQPEEWEALPANAPKTTKGLKGVWEDYINLHKAAPKMVGNAVMSAPGAIKGMIQHPQRIPQNMAAGLFETARFAPSIPPAIGDYLANKELISQETAAKIPHTPFTGRELAGVQGEEEGDILGEMLGGFLTGGPGSINAAKKGAMAAIRSFKALYFFKRPIVKRRANKKP
jgi:hypothetical protein